MRLSSLKIIHYLILSWISNIELASVIEEQSTLDTRTFPNLPRQIIRQSGRDQSSRHQTKSEQCVNDDPNIKELNLSDKGSRFVHSFTSCINLQRIWMTRNSLTTLPSNIFSENILLEEIYLNDNLLTIVDPLWFKSCAKTLRVLDVSNNCLIELNLDQFATMAAMERFFVSQNHLININETLVIKKFPKLRHFTFQYNQIGCWRQHDLISYFIDNSNIVTNDSKVNESKSVRFDQSKDDRGCIREEDWNYLMLTRKQEIVVKTVENISVGVDPMIVWICLGMSCLAIAFNLLLCIYVYRKISLAKNKSIQVLSTELGEYYDSYIQGANREEDQNGPTYATVDRNRER